MAMNGLAGARGKIVHRLRDHLFARAGRADDQRVGLGRPQCADQTAQVDHRRASPRQSRLKIVALPGGGAQAAVLDHKPAKIEGAAQEGDQALGC